MFPPFALRLIRGCVVAALFASPLSIRAADAHSDHGDHGAEETPLHQAMEKLGKSYGALARGMRNPDPAKKAEYLELVKQMQTHANAAKTYIPKIVEKLPEAERPAQIEAYRKDLAATIEAMNELELAITADDWEKAKSLAQELRAKRNDAHKKFAPEEDK